MKPNDFLQPMGIGELLDKTIELYKRDFGKYFAITFIGYLPMILLMAVAFIIFALNPGFQAGFESGEPGFIMQFIGIILFVTILGSVGLSIFMVALIKASSDGIFGREISIGGSMKVGLKKFFPYFVTGTFYIIALSFGYVLLIIPGLLFTAWFMFFGQVVVLEGTGYISALRRSYSLVKGYFWRTTGLWFVAYLFGFVVVGTLSQVLGMIPLIGPIISIFAQMLIMPFQFISQTLYYYNQRAVKEGHDLELRAEGMAFVEPGTMEGEASSV